MSAIGDYVHLHAENYKQYGTTFKGPKDTINFSQQKNRIANKIKASGITNVNNLENALTNILSTQDDSKSVEAQIQKKIEDILNKRFAESMQKINWETGDVVPGLARGREKTESSTKQIASQQYTYVSSILARIRAIKEARNGIKSEMKKTELNNILNKIYIDLNAILTEGKKIGKITALKNETLDKELLNKRIMLNDPNAKNLITLINETLKKYATLPAVNLQKGDLFEYAIALAPAIARVQAGESIDKVCKELEKTVVGGDRSRIEIDFDKNNFTNSLDLNQLKNLGIKGYYVSPTNKTMISYGTSQDKIDIVLEWEGKNYNVSAKNVNLKGRDVHILSGSSLLYLIQDEPADFINHYLNIIATHPDGNNLGADVAQAHNAMKYTLLFKALTGGTYGREDKKAELFIVNDNSVKAGGVKVFEIADLIKKASGNLDAYTKITANEVDLKDLRVENKFDADGYSDRITTFISRIHQQKISASLKPALLT